MSGMNLSLQQMHQWLPGSRLVGDASLHINRVHTDSRSVLADDLFVALQGERFDAHSFLAQLPGQGVKVAIAQHGLGIVTAPRIQDAGQHLCDRGFAVAAGHCQQGQFKLHAPCVRQCLQSLQAVIHL